MLIRMLQILSHASLATLLFASAPTLSAASLEAIRLSPDGKSSILADSKTEFRVWGVNYDHDSHGTGRSRWPVKS